MTNIEKVNKALENADESKIKEVLDFLGYEEDSKFIPKKGERYYFIAGLGFIKYHYWVDDEYDNYVLLMNNAYRTEEEAEQALSFQTRKAKLIKEIEDSSDDIDWIDGNQNKYHIWIDRYDNTLHVIDIVRSQTQGAIHTTDGLFLEELIKTRADEVKELLFGIK